MTLIDLQEALEVVFYELQMRGVVLSQYDRNNIVQQEYDQINATSLTTRPPALTA